MTEEIWKEIEGYAGLYEVSNLGRVRSLDRRVNTPGGKRVIPGRIIKTRLNKQGYNIVTLTVNREPRTFRVARLVASAFIPNPDSLPQVNHIDETRTNDTVNNLEWCSVYYNLTYGSRLKRISESAKKTPVLMLSNGKKIKAFPSARSAAIYLGNPAYRGNIAACARGDQRTAYGYEWRHA